MCKPSWSLKKKICSTKHKRFRPFYVKIVRCVYLYVCNCLCAEPGRNAKTFTRRDFRVGSERRDCGHGFFSNIHLSTSQFQAPGYGGQQPQSPGLREGPGPVFWFAAARRAERALRCVDGTRGHSTWGRGGTERSQGAEVIPRVKPAASAHAPFGFNSPNLPAASPPQPGLTSLYCRQSRGHGLNPVTSGETRSSGRVRCPQDAPSA